ncbi:uncharacterized protein [Panulirus ornatus]|uniref:uncharacterized protein isoform X2 n=1 Tax=Panulirus ornatus TaxID=150431 RepID=UPI003A88FBEB
MSSDVVVMQRPIKVEIHSPVKPEILKPSNAANLQNITNIAANFSSKPPPVTSKATTNTSNKSTSNTTIKTTDSSFNRNVSGKVNVRIHPITSKASVIRSSSPQVAKSPFKPLTPIRPSPTVKTSIITTRSPPSSTVTTIIRTPKSVVKPLGSASLSSSLSMSTSSSSSSSSINLSTVKCRRKINYTEDEARVPVSRRNARERNRVKQVSQGFAILRQHVPHAARKKKLSKVETLRCAVDYIRGLQLLLDDHPTAQTAAPIPSTATHHLPTTHHHHHHHQQQLQQQHPQVFLQPHHAIEPHILKLPAADETFQSPLSLWQESVAGAFIRTSPTHSEGGHSPAQSLYSDKFSPPTTTNTTISPALSVGVGMIKSEGGEGRSYAREEQDLLDALAWWQHNIQQ